MKPYRLYTRNQTGGMAVEAALKLSGVTFDTVTVPRPDALTATADFAKVNPRLQVPVLIHPDGTVITEGPAILAHIGDAFPAAGLIPTPGTALRATHDRWLGFFHANVYEAMLREFRPERYTTDPTTASPVRFAATAYIRRHFQIFESELTGGPFLTGQTVLMVDIYLWMLCFWTDLDWLATHCPRIHDLWSTAQSHPTLARIAATHFP